eukprot:1950615-Rhodomonas_salina.1
METNVLLRPSSEVAKEGRCTLRIAALKSVSVTPKPASASGDKTFHTLSRVRTKKLLGSIGSVFYKSWTSVLRGGEPLPFLPLPPPPLTLSPSSLDVRAQDHDPNPASAFIRPHPPICRSAAQHNQ